MDNLLIEINQTHNSMFLGVILAYLCVVRGATVLLLLLAFMFQLEMQLQSNMRSINSLAVWTLYQNRFT